MDSRDSKEFNDQELIDRLIERYKPSVIPPCCVCGKELTIQAIGGGRSTVWACYEPRDSFGKIDWNHYSLSRYEDRRQGGDEDVMELIRRFNKDHWVCGVNG